MSAANAVKGEEWTKGRLQEMLKTFHDAHYSWDRLGGTPFDALRKAAVLMAVFIHAGEPHIWLTQRSATLRHDKSDVAFPGGMKDPEDKNETSTALREAEEEIGLKSNQVEVVSQLPPRVNRRGLLVSPVVGIVDSDFVPLASPDEVARVFHLPLSRFLSQKGHSCTLFKNRFMDINVHFFTDEIEDIEVVTWGLTGTLCLELACGVLQKTSDFLYDPGYELPVSDPFIRQRQYLELYENSQSKM